MVVAKGLVVLSWLFGMASFLATQQSVATEWGRRIFWFLLIAHVIECVIFLPKLRKLPGSIGHHLVQTMLFGVLHVRSAESAAGQ